ncbi:hypothetical protein B0H34DRAFT_728735 [Crassisporium funariophilum]|nr:hypothetical protein B0H34DRAFT_728735 [Crassisporium funariophilum]
MPVGRSNTLRSKSRSPAPPVTPIPTTPRQFLPPSHYAAAGGFTSRTPVSPFSNGYGDSVDRREITAVHKARMHNKGTTHVSRQQKSSNPSCSYEPQSAEAILTESNSTLKRRDSRPGFPNLESQLLPSLRDTIDRMTLSPSRLSTSPRSDAGYTDGEQKATRKQKQGVSPEARLSPTYHPGKFEPSFNPRLADSTDTTDMATTPYLACIYPNQSTPTLGKQSSRAKTPTKSALKSSLRSPTPKLSSLESPITGSSSLAGSSLKSVKSLLSRKNSGTPKSSPKISQVPRKWSLKDTQPDQSKSKSPKLKSRTHAELGRPDCSGPSNSSRSTETLNTGASVSTKSFSSSIPRPRAILSVDNVSIDESDVERRYETETRNRRKLTVANAEVSESASSSDSGFGSSHQFESGKRTHSWKSPKSIGDASRSAGAVGLGLSFPQDLARRDNKASRPWESGNVRGESTRAQMQEKTLRFSLPASESAGSSYSDDFTNYRPESFRKSRGTGDLDADHARRKEAFMNIISDLGQLETPNPVQPRSHGSPKLSANPFASDDDSESEREGYSVRRPKSKEWPRSSSCTPKIQASLRQNEEHATPILPRPRSACNRYTSQSPKDFPSSPRTLQELIQSRNKSAAFSRRGSSSPSNLPRQHPHENPDSLSEQFDNNEGYSDVESDIQSRCYEPAHRRLADYPQTEAVSIVQQYHSIAAKERSAFGIPPSESDEVHCKAERQQEQELSHADSQISFLSDSVWQEDSEELSEGAESIFRTFSGEKTKEVPRRSHLAFDSIYDSTPRLSVISPTLSASSTYEAQTPETMWQRNEPAKHPTRNSKRHSGPFPIQETPTSSSQDVPKTREGVIQEIFESEEDLLRLLHICMRLFILPLRMENSRSWIVGMPPNVARLLDWFDDIVNLHEEIYQSLCSARDTQSPTTDRVSESLRCFVNKVEVYQPYLVRLADVSEEIASLTGDSKNDFGQFINIQERGVECEGWSFDRLLMLPVHRLTAYQDLFGRMLDLTPKTHQDYLSTFSLSRSTDMVIKVLMEVKIREDEYNLIKVFSTRLQGLSAENQLATRERRLLHSGPLGLVLSDHTPLSVSSHQVTGSKGSDLSLAALDDWGLDLKNSGLGKSKTSCKFSSMLNSSKPSCLPIAAASPPVKASWFSKLPLRKRSRSKSSQSSKETLECDNVNNIQLSDMDAGSLPTPVHAFVFSDLVLLAQPRQTSDEEPQWVLLHDIGIFKPLSISQRNGQKDQEAAVIYLEAIVLDAEQLNESTEFRSSCLKNVTLVTPLLPPGDCDKIEVMGPWLEAFRQCRRSTLQKLAFPAHQDGLGSDQILDTHLAVSSLVGSGLPMPRSPSGHFPEILGTNGKGFAGGEREERGWWSLRYQQVFRELQRQDQPFSDDEEDVSSMRV